MTTIILVHGTFARDAQWIEQGSLLVQAVRKLLQLRSGPANFVSLKWSGRNLIEHRLAASEGLRNQVDEIWRKSPTEKIFVIGHSHGGSAISYYLKQYPESAACITGAIFLSTPFVTFKLKENLAGRVIAYSYATYLSAQVVSLALIKLLPTPSPVRVSGVKSAGYANIELLPR